MTRAVLDKGFVNLIAFMGGDLSVVNSARVSFSARVDSLTDADKGLVGFLMRERHGSPFEHSVFTFHVRCPIFVAREWQRHRIGSYNELSMRYAKVDPDFYIPSAKNVRVRIGKPGRYEHVPADEFDALHYIKVLEAACASAALNYKKCLDMDLAPEVARNFLPVNTYTEFYWTVNARSLMNFLSLRNTPQALYEIREYAKVLETIFSEEMPVTANAFVENERNVP